MHHRRKPLPVYPVFVVLYVLFILLACMNIALGSAHGATLPSKFKHHHSFCQSHHAGSIAQLAGGTLYRGG